ncbi:MAG: hypothetical protein OEL76_09825 [Siculibacillus sp.]|nr:hypothetical protein [Siculibacillus sp.]
MRVAGGYLGAALVSAVIAVALLVWGWVDPTAPAGPVQVPGWLIGWSPDIAIRFRNLGTFLASAGPEVTIPLRLAAALLLFLIVDLVALVLYETTDEAWRGVAVWEAAKPLWVTLIFTIVTSALYMAALEWRIAPVPRLGLSPSGFALAALIGGLFFGLGRPRNEPIDE